MTSDMCGIETRKMRVMPRMASWGRLIGMWGVRRVPPLQGGDGFVGVFSQGDALGCRVAAPSARGRACNRRACFTPDRCREDGPRARGRACEGVGSDAIGVGPRTGRRQAAATCRLPAPTGQNPTAWGNAPGTPVTNTSSPERAIPGRGQTRERDLEQAIAANLAEILEA